ncbi:MAG: hydroxyacid dehydrogenase [Spirochaetaceae bacterium]|nr:hydroxyacid dehydrogenase [Spirochaetaceae bacterium]|tara:strand:- start:288165 stop:289172 length:1008 start_codon:yes stop_codon:yes gene_type:complete
MKIAFFSTRSYDKQFFNRMNPDYGHEITYLDASLSPLTASLARGHQAVCVFVNDRLDAETIEELSNVGVSAIALRCAGFNNVDLKAAAARGITVVRVPAYSPHAVAEHAVALILTLNRKTHKAYNRVRESNFALDGLVGFDLNQKVVGVIGMGKIGSVFANIMLGFGCSVLAYDPLQETHLEQDALGRKIQFVDLPTLYSKADIISLHCPLTEQTRHLIGEEAIMQMKPGVMIINTSRGLIIDTPAVIRGLKQGIVGSLGIDVYEQEDDLFFADHSADVLMDDDIARLLTFPNVLITGHQAFFTENALREIAHVTLQNLKDLETGKEAKNEVKIG